MKKFWTYFLPIIISIVSIWFLLYFLLTYKFKLSVETSFNSLNSIFAAFGVAGVIVTILIQQKELNLQLQEQKDTRKEFEQQNKTLRKQRFENTFYNLLSVHHSIVEKLYLFNSGIEHRSRDVIRHFYTEFKGHFLNEYRAIGSPKVTIENAEEHKHLVAKCFNEKYAAFEEHLGHYQNNFSTLVKIVKVSTLIDDSNRELYYTILKSQLNSYEILFLFYLYHCGRQINNKEYFNLLTLGSSMNSGLLLDISHTFLYDPPHVVNAALTTKWKI